ASVSTRRTCPTKPVGDQLDPPSVLLRMPGAVRSTEFVAYSTAGFEADALSDSPLNMNGMPVPWTGLHDAPPWGALRIAPGSMLTPVLHATNVVSAPGSIAHPSTSGL